MLRYVVLLREFVRQFGVFIRPHGMRFLLRQQLWFLLRQRLWLALRQLQFLLRK